MVWIKWIVLEGLKIWALGHLKWNVCRSGGRASGRAGGRADGRAGGADGYHMAEVNYVSKTF